jgi:polyhydroxyalkanoate synthesis regulator protein
MQEFARKLAIAYKKLQDLVDPRNSGILNPKLDEMFLRNPKDALETFNAMLQSAKKYYKDNNQLLGRNDAIRDIKIISDELKAIKSDVKKLAPEALGTAAKKPMEQMLTFIEKLFEMFAKMMAPVQGMQNISAPKELRKPRPGVPGGGSRTLD